MHGHGKRRREIATACSQFGMGNAPISTCAAPSLSAAAPSERDDAGSRMRSLNVDSAMDDASTAALLAARGGDSSLLSPRSNESIVAGCVAAGVAGPTLRSSMSSWRARQVLKATDVEK